MKQKKTAHTHTQHNNSRKQHNSKRNQQPRDDKQQSDARKQQHNTLFQFELCSKEFPKSSLLVVFGVLKVCLSFVRFSRGFVCFPVVCFLYCVWFSLGLSRCFRFLGVWQLAHYQSPLCLFEATAFLFCCLVPREGHRPILRQTPCRFWQKVPGFAHLVYSSPCLSQVYPKSILILGEPSHVHPMAETFDTGPSWKRISGSESGFSEVWNPKLYSW